MVLTTRHLCHHWVRPPCHVPRKRGRPLVHLRAQGRRLWGRFCSHLLFSSKSPSTAAKLPSPSKNSSAPLRWGCVDRTLQDLKSEWHMSAPDGTSGVHRTRLSQCHEGPVGMPSCSMAGMDTTIRSCVLLRAIAQRQSNSLDSVVCLSMSVLAVSAAQQSDAHCKAGCA